jgi:hypothetical protein
MKNDINQFFATSTGRVLLVVVLLGIGFWGGIEYKSYQIRKAVSDVLVPIQQAAVKQEDATVRANLDNLRAEAALYYDSNKNSYTGVCTNSDFISGLNDASNAGGSTSTCNVSPDGQNFAVATALKSNPKTFQCVDSNGSSMVIMNPLGSTTACK